MFTAYPGQIIWLSMLKMVALIGMLYMAVIVVTWFGLVAIDMMKKDKEQD